MARQGVSAARGIVLVCLLALLPALLPAKAEKPTGNSTLIRIGVVSSLFRDVPDPLAQAMLRPMKALIEVQTGLQGDVSRGGDALQLGQKLSEDQVQLGVFHGFEFAWARLKFPRLQPLVIAVNKHRQMKALVIVRRDCTAPTLVDLRGKTLALPKFSREYCYLFVERSCLEKGETAPTLFGKVTRPDDIEDALDDLVDKAVDVTVVDNVALETYQQRKPGRFAKLRVLAESEPFPAAVVAYCPGGLDEARLARFHDGMIGASQTERGKRMLSLCRMTGFEDVPADYDALLSAVAKAYPPPKCDPK